MTKEDQVISAVCLALDGEAMKVTADDIKGPLRKHYFVIGRQLTCFILRQMGYGVERIGSIINRDHSSVTYGEVRAVEMIETEGHVGRAFLHVCKLIKMDPPDWLHPQVNDRIMLVSHKTHFRDIMRPNKAALVRIGSKKSEEVEKEEEEGAYIAPKEWTAEERRILKKNAEYPGAAFS